MYLKSIIKRDYNKWYSDPYIYEKVNDKYEYITFGKFIENSLGIANDLIKRGYKNKRIMIISENSTKLMEVDIAVTFYVGLCAIVSKEWKKTDLIQGIDELKADLLLYSDNYKDVVKDVLKERKIDSMHLNDLDTSFNNSLFDLPIKNKNKPAKIVFSSGTTGKSKAVMLSLKNIFAGYNSLTRRCPFNHKDSTYLLCKCI